MNVSYVDELMQSRRAAVLELIPEDSRHMFLKIRRYFDTLKEYFSGRLSRSDLDMRVRTLLPAASADVSTSAVNAHNELLLTLLTKAGLSFAYGGAFREAQPWHNEPRMRKDGPPPTKQARASVSETGPESIKPQINCLPPPASIDLPALAVQNTFVHLTLIKNIVSRVLARQRTHLHLDARVPYGFGVRKTRADNRFVCVPAKAPIRAADVCETVKVDPWLIPHDILKTKFIVSLECPE